MTKLSPAALTEPEPEPEGPSLKEQALAVIKNSEICDHVSIDHADILRRALEALPE